MSLRKLRTVIVKHNHNQHARICSALRCCRIKFEDKEVKQAGDNGGLIPVLSLSCFYCLMLNAHDCLALRFAEIIAMVDTMASFVQSANCFSLSLV